MDKFDLTKPHQLPFELFTEVCSVIADTGFFGSVEEYIKTYYGKSFAQLTVNEAEVIVRTLSTKKGCLYEGKAEDLIPTPEKEDDGISY